MEKESSFIESEFIFMSIKFVPKNFINQNEIRMYSNNGNTMQIQKGVLKKEDEDNVRNFHADLMNESEEHIFFYFFLYFLLF